ncbi:portal protein [Myxococcus phage Mx8]|uniref:Virion structural protein n=1 Tax=Myxococcus phage Mx8 TaxID=49964 RepID=Q94MS4_9CAUD|nr:portal protein [Myxococcus phage Mx8]AAK94380.1 virion structural protein [Myxococcus phage Mx8]
MNESQPTDFADTPQGWAQRWQEEMSAAREPLEKWHTQGKEIVKRYRDERDSAHDAETRWNLFSTNIQTQMASLYGQTPKVSVSRRFADADDDVARVASELLERLLNTDIEKDSDTFQQALEYALQDRLLPGFGLCRIRYEVEWEEVAGVDAILDEATGAELAAAVPPTQRKAYECVETDYLHWQDVLWSPARVWHEVRWLAFRNLLDMREFNARFDADGSRNLWASVPKVGKPKDGKDGQSCHPWDRAEVWEIWDKGGRKVDWYVEGYSAVLDTQPDPLGLESFFPCPKPLLANWTTDKVVPRPDFVLAQDLYKEIDLVSTRITLLERAIRVVGVYDKSSGLTIGRLLSEAAQNDLIPVENWLTFADKGGLRGVVDWFPLEPVVAALTSLRDYRRELVDALHQVTGMADIMRGASDPRETAMAQGVKAKFGSIRLQRLQDEVARFASDIQRLKAEVIAEHYDVASILAQANAEFTFDKELAPKAAELIKSRFSMYRVEVKPEAVSLQDFAALRNEKMEVLSGIASFMQGVAPLAQQVPGSAPFLLQMLKWSVSGLRGSSTIEGVLDKAIAAAEEAQKQAAQQSPAPQQPDPKVVAQAMKGQQEMAKVQAEVQGDLLRIQAETQANETKERQQAEWNVREAAQKNLISQAARAMNPQARNGGMP